MSSRTRSTLAIALIVSAASIVTAQQIPSAPTNLRVVGLEPVIGGVTASSVTAAQATITWTTDTLSDSQVEYGLTTAYGSASGLNTTLVTAHAMTVTGLSAGKVYHFRVHSREVGGTRGTSGDYTFTTPAAPDTTNPAVSITAPAPGATVSGTTAVSAGASDDIGVAGVQFKIDGVNLGVEDTAAPYSTPWNTTAAANGAHSLSAVARDAAGNTSTSSISVTVANDSTPPQLSGVSASSITASGAAISWTTNEASNSQVQYGTTTAYGSTTPLNGSLVTAHTVTVSGLSASTLYHYRVRSRDAAGNLATSGDFTFSTAPPADTTKPAVAISAPAGGATVSQTVSVSATASDNVGVAGVQFKLDGANLGAEDTAAPYSVSWNTATAANGSHALTAVARDGAGNTTTSAAVSVTVSNVVTTILTLSPQDTSITLDATNHSTAATLTTYTWPSQRVANAIVMKFDLASLPPGAVVQDATLHLALLESDASADATYAVAVHKIVSRNPVITAATGYTYDGVTGWTANACCDNNVPMAQADISPAYDTPAIDKALGVKTWTITSMVEEWAADPATNFGLLLNSDASKLADRYRYFASMEHADPALRPVLRISYTLPPADVTQPSVSITAPAADATVSGSVTVSASATDDERVAGVQFKLNGVNLGAEDLTAPYSVTWNTTTAGNGAQTLTAVARDAAGNRTTSAAVGVTVANDITAPSVSIAAPAAGATVSGTITVSATASDDVGVAGVRFKLNGVNLGIEDTTAPYSVSWNTTTATNGPQALTAVARDAAGNTRTSAAVSVTVSNDTTMPVVSVTAPAGGTTVSGTVTVAANASDTVGVAGVQFKLDGTNLGAEDTTAPYSVAWDTIGATNASHTLTAVARDAAGNSATSAAVSVTVSNIVTTTLTLSPQDTSLDLNTTNFSTATTLTTYTWPNQRVANAILMKFDLASLPLGAVLQDATLQLALVEADASADATYSVAVHKIVGRNPLIAAATGYTSDGVTGWTPNTCCSDNVPMAQADIAAACDTQAIDKTLGFKSWDVTAVVEEWAADPLTNFGLLLNSDASKPADRYRFFASMEHADPALRPHLRITYTVPPPDPTAPTVSMTAPAPGATVSGTVTVSANASDNVAVASVQFQLDGANLGMRDTTAPYSIQWNTTTVTAGSHTIRAVAKDIAGNSTTSAGTTVTVLDVTAPAVSITAPSAGMTVTGSVSVTATATDVGSVAGVQFKLNGANLGTDDTSAPYSVSWNTTGVADGSHTLTAVARDAAGNQRTSSAVAVTVSNTAPPPANGIATLYPGDVGIENDANVIFVERFDESALTNLFSRWNDVLNGSSMSFSSDAPAGSPVTRSLNIPWASANTGGHLYRQLSPGIDDTLYVRYYIKYPTTGTYNHTGIWIGGNNPPLTYPNPQAGVKPTGSDRFIAGAEQNTATGTGLFDHYNYWMSMRQSLDGSYWGNLLLNDSGVRARTGQWMCVEHMVKLNNPTTAFNGEHAIWLDGVKVSHLGQGFPKGSWTGGIFTQDPAGSPFEGFRWRSTSSLNLNWIWLQVYGTEGSGSIKYAHVVAARSYIGCLTSGSSDTSPPTASISSPTTGATVSGTVTVSASASDNLGVAGVQFQLDGVDLGAEDTSAPYSVSWNTTAVPNGSHTLRAVARDAAGNQTTSPAMSVTVSNAAPPPSGVVFESNWDTATGTLASAVTDGGRWPKFDEYGGAPYLLSVVSGGPDGHNALRVQQRGEDAANLQIDNFLPQSQDYYLRFYFMNDDTSSANDHIATVDTFEYWNLTFMRKFGGATSYRYDISLYGCGFTYPIGHWTLRDRLNRGQWYRLEYFVDFVSANRVQVHPRVYDMSGNLLYSDADYRQEDYNAGGSWSGRDDWTLASYYAAGHSFCVEPQWMNDFGLGNNGAAGAANTGLYWYFAGIQIRKDTWPGPVAAK